MRKRFKRIYIEITNVCNLNCPFCAQDSRKKEFISKEQFIKVIEQIKEYTDYVYFHVKGEPCLHPMINELIEIAYDNGLQVNLTTNGTCINQLQSKHIRQINYSMQSAKNVEEIEEILQKIKEYISGTNIYLSLRLWSKESQQDQDIQNMLKREFSLQEEIRDKMTLDQKVFLSIEKEFEWPSLTSLVENEKGFCYGGRDQIAILVNGDIVPCCLDHQGSVVLGNIYQEDFSIIIESKRLKELVKGFERRCAVEELCRKCGFKDKF